MACVDLAARSLKKKNEKKIINVVRQVLPRDLKVYFSGDTHIQDEIISQTDSF